MKKIEIITMHNVPNYGSFLQTYATQRIVENIGCKAEIIDYVPYVRSSRFFLFDHLGKKKNFLNEIATILFYFIPRIKTLKMFRREQKYYYYLSERYRSKSQFENEPLDADYYMTGSDQVWSSITNLGYDGVYFLDFIDSPNKLAFSASIGMDNLDADYMKKVQSALNTYKAISVREYSAVELLTKMGVNDVQHLIDPTQILTQEEWEDYISSSDLNIREKRYVLLYILGRDDDAIEYANIIAKKLDAKVVKISWDGIYSKYVERFYKYVRPADMLKLIKNADFIVTNSFHGTALSIEFNRQFITTSKDMNVRFASVLNMFGLIERFHKKNEFDLNRAMEHISYERINEILQSYREKSYEFLNTYIND